MFGKPYRPCPVCKTGLSELMKRNENGRLWEAFTCPNCGSEVWIDPFKELTKLMDGR